MMLIKLFIFFLITVDIARLVYIQSLYPSCITKNGFAGLIGYQHYSWLQG